MNTQQSQSQSQQSSQAQLIEVVLTWGRDVVEVRHLDHTHTSLTVGTRPQDDLFLPLTHAASVELLSRAPQGWIITPLDGISAPVLVADLPAHVAARAGGEELACYDVGPFTLRIRRVEKARRLTLVPVFDALWANVATVTMAAMVAVVTIASFLPEGSVEPTPDAPVHMQRFMTIALKKDPPQPKKDMVKISDPMQRDESRVVAETKPRADVKRTKESDAKVVESKLAMLFGDDGAGGTLAGGDNDALMAALGNIDGKKVAGHGPKGALGLRPGAPGTAPGTKTYGIGKIAVGDVTNGKEPGGDLGPRTEREVATATLLEPEVPPNVDKEIIRKVVRTHVDQVRHCYEKTLQVNAGLAGKVSMRWTIAADGTVLHAQHVRSGRDGADRGLDDVGACLAKAVRTWRFPAFVKAPTGGVVVQYPFVFKAG